MKVKSNKTESKLKNPIKEKLKNGKSPKKYDKKERKSEKKVEPKPSKFAQTFKKSSPSVNIADDLTLTDDEDDTLSV